MIEEHHNSKIYEHSKVKKIMEHIQKNYYFSNMRKLMKKHIAVYAECNQNKAARHKPYEKIRTFEILRQA